MRRTLEIAKALCGLVFVVAIGLPMLAVGIALAFIVERIGRLKK